MGIKRYTQPQKISSARVLAALLLAVAGVISARAQEDPVVATINNEKVHQSEVFIRLQRLKSQDFIKKPVPLTMYKESAGTIVLGNIITEHIIIQLARREGVMPTEAEVQAQLAPILEKANVKKMIDARLFTAGEYASGIRVLDANRNLENKFGSRAAVEKRMAAFRKSSQITIALAGYDDLQNTPQ